MPSEKQANRVTHRARISAPALVMLVVLLILPSVALSRLSGWIDWRILVGVPLALSVVSYFLYRRDKHRAEAGAWRIPESTLHLADLLGGWPGAFLAQRLYRHKISKRSFQFFFWLVVLSHQCLAADFLLDWRFTKQAMHFLKSQLG